jgi:hypothetical protein
MTTETMLAATPMIHDGESGLRRNEWPYFASVFIPPGATQDKSLDASAPRTTG